MKTTISVALISVLILFLASCKKDNNTSSGQYKTGYNASTENVSTIPVSLNTKNLGATSSSLPTSFDLTPYLPPVGDQGQYGTCIAWSSAYYMKTTIEGISKGYSASLLAQAANQMSPKDLFTAIPDADKGANCDGTNFNDALTVMQNRGVATLQTVPYTGLGSCSQSTLDPSWANDAANHTISTFRTVNATVNDIKQNLVNKSPVLIGIAVGTGFQNWRGSGVMTTGFDPCGGGSSCGGHAQCIVGYDDSKGSGGAFRIVNSWGSTTWGDNGFYWVDYNFLFNTLAQKDPSGNYCIFVADNGNSVTPPTVNPSSSGVDLAAWVEEDVSTSTGSSPTRSCVFNIYNIGTGTASASSNWGLYYVYYNAFNANDYGVIFFDAFNTSITQNTYSCSSSGDSCIINIDIPGGTDFATVAYSQSVLHQNYTMPPITGDYYLILVADAGEVLNDVNYNNNIFYTSSLPASFSDGYHKTDSYADKEYENKMTPTRELLKKSAFNTAVTKATPNAYTPYEIQTFLKAKKASGELDAKVRNYVNSHPTNSGLSRN